MNPKTGISAPKSLSAISLAFFSKTESNSLIFEFISVFLSEYTLPSFKIILLHTIKIANIKIKKISLKLKSFYLTI